MKDIINKILNRYDSQTGFGIDAATDDLTDLFKCLLDEKHCTCVDHYVQGSGGDWVKAGDKKVHLVEVCECQCHLKGSTHGTICPKCVF